jgi:hypothetical protein
MEVSMGISMPDIGSLGISMPDIGSLGISMPDIGSLDISMPDVELPIDIRPSKSIFIDRLIE